MKKYWNSQDDKELLTYFETNVMSNQLFKKLMKIVEIIRTKYYAVDDNEYDSEALLYGLYYVKNKHDIERGSIFNLFSYKVKAKFYDEYVRKKKNNKININEIDVNQFSTVDKNYDIINYDKIYETACKRIDTIVKEKNTKFTYVIHADEVKKILKQYIDEQAFFELNFGHYLYEKMSDKISQKETIYILQKLKLNPITKRNNELHRETEIW